jgi:hypothetical protein
LDEPFHSASVGFECREGAIQVPLIVQGAAEAATTHRQVVLAIQASGIQPSQALAKGCGVSEGFRGSTKTAKNLLDHADFDVGHGKVPLAGHVSRI